MTESRAHFLPALAHAVEIAGHELQLRVAERCPLAVRDRHPAIEVGQLVVARHRSARSPPATTACREIRGFDAVLCAAPVIERPDEGWPRVQVSG
jgi:hypothetical protein